MTISIGVPQFYTSKFRSFNAKLKEWQPLLESRRICLLTPYVPETNSAISIGTEYCLVLPWLFKFPPSLRFGPKPGSSSGTMTALVTPYDVGNSSLHFWWQQGQIWHQYCNSARLAQLMALVPPSRLSSHLRGNQRNRRFDVYNRSQEYVSSQPIDP